MATSIERFREAVMASTLYDKDYFAFVFSGEHKVPLSQLVLRTVIERDNITVRTAQIEHDVANLLGRAIRMDVMAVDQSASTYDLEFQRDDDGARPQRARYNASVIDANYELKGVDPRRIHLHLPETYVIFITETDVLGRGRPIYHVERMVVEDGVPFNDGSHIIYVNGAYERTDTPLGRLIHDFRCPRASDMLVPELAARTRELKETEKGAREMSSALWEEVRAEMRAEARADLRAELRADLRAELRAEISTESYNKGMIAGISAGRSEGIVVGEANGELKTYIGLVRDNIMEPSIAAARLHISESEFRAKCDAAPNNVF